MMSRVIKFRAWIEEENKFSMVESIKLFDSVAYVYDSYDDYEYQIQPEHLQQFTGLQDKNNKDIYEGDIVRVNARYDKAEGEVVFHECAWCFVVPVEGNHENPYRNIGTGWYGIEVIGNIYESVELLKQSEKEE